jgi:hypothetical protein
MKEFNSKIVKSILNSIVCLISSGNTNAKEVLNKIMFDLLEFLIPEENLSKISVEVYVDNFKNIYPSEIILNLLFENSERDEFPNAQDLVEVISPLFDVDLFSINIFKKQSEASIKKELKF